MITFSSPIPPSVNHAYANANHGRRVLTMVAKQWMEIAEVCASVAARSQGWEFSQGEKLVMEMTVFWPDNRRRDTHNLHKLTADAFEGILYKDDKNVLIHDMDFTIDRKNPRVEYRIYRKENKHA